MEVTTENRLCLKRSNVKSTPKNVLESNIQKSLDQENKMSKEFDNKNVQNITSVIEDDSLLDFKSPKSKIARQKFNEFNKPHNAKQKKKTSGRFKCVISDQKQSKLKKLSEKNKNIQEYQPPIESSFFKSTNNKDSKDSSTDVKVAFVCPVCLKTCKDEDSQALHMKICALKNNVSTKMLLNAIELQKRQEDERKSLGLARAPMIQDKKKSVPRKTNMYDESDIELALALSKSCYEAEELNNINPIECSSSMQTQLVSEPSSKGLLEKFGFANNKPPSYTSSKRKRCSRITVLQTRSQDERNRILTEKIAEILVGNDPITQIQREDKNRKEVKEEFVMKSHLLKHLCHKEERLWDKARLTPNQKHFYVTNLSEHIVPNEEVTIEEDDYRNLNQSPPRINDNEQQLCDISKTELCGTKEYCEKYDEKFFIDTLVMSWGNALNDSSASDLIIFVNNNDNYIWAHKLVFYVRCSNILLDVTCNDNSQFSMIKEKICWLDVPYDIALAFLEFIYCGILKKHLRVLEDIINFSVLRNLARKYKVKELFAYLQNKKTAAVPKKIQAHNMEQIQYEESVLTQKENTLDKSKETLELDELEDSSEQLLKNILNKSESPETELKITSPYISNKQSPMIERFHVQELNENSCMELSPKEQINDENSTRQFNTSPDMFDNTVSSFNSKYTDVTLDSGKIEENKDLSNQGTRNHVIIDISNEEVSINEENIPRSQQTENNTSFKDDEGGLHSLVNTPKSKKLQRKSVTNSVMVNVKSNLSLFIEQFQRENADSDLNVYSDISVVETPKLNRNPFKYSIAEDFTDGKKNVWDKLDCHNVSSKLYINTSDKENNTVTSLNFDTESSTENCTEEYAHNSQLNNSTSSSETNLHGKVASSVSEHLLKEKSSIPDLQETMTQASVLQCEKEDSIVLSDTDSDDTEVSMYAKYKKSHKNNSIVKYRHFVQNHGLNDSVENKSLENESERKSSIDNDVTVLSDFCTDSNFINTSIEKCINGSERKQSTSDLERSEQILEEHFNNEIIMDDKNEEHCLANTKSPINNWRSTPKRQGMKSSNKLRHNKSENNINIEMIKYDLMKKSLQQDTSESDLPGSPVLVSSSPEYDFNAPNASSCSENHNILKSRTPDDFSRILQNDIYLANVEINYDSNSSDSPLSLTKGKRNSVCTNKENTDILSSLMNNKDNRVTKSNSFTQELRNVGNYSNPEQSIRKFQRKSMSESNIGINIKNVRNRGTKACNGSSQVQCECGREKVFRTSPIIVRDNVTPPPNYNEMKTPELHAELNKYGLKMQKRSRAVKLLTYIYNELHPKIHSSLKEHSEFKAASSEDEGPPKKKSNYINSDDDCDFLFSQNSCGSMQSPINIMDEEKQFDEIEPVAATDGTSNIKDAFLKLLNTRNELHNKILTYEPICIDALHTMLKTEGFKCKKSTVMDFLDEQCITFYFQNAKQKRDTKK